MRLNNDFVRGLLLVSAAFLVAALIAAGAYELAKTIPGVRAIANLISTLGFMGGLMFFFYAIRDRN